MKIRFVFGSFSFVAFFPVNFFSPGFLGFHTVTGASTRAKFIPKVDAFLIRPAAHGYVPSTEIALVVWKYLAACPA